MMTLSWRFAFASVIGTSHTKSGLPCQDASICRTLTASSGEPVLVAVVSDGAGSADRSQIGSQLACALFMDEMVTLFGTGGVVEDVTEVFCKQWLISFQHEVGSRAEAEGVMPRAFACTILAAVIGATSSAFCQIGDGAIVTQPQDSPGEYCYIFWPEKGEYANQTFFATDTGAGLHLQHETVPYQIHEIALFSDGLERLALHMETQTAHTPFFKPMFVPLHKASDGYAETLSSSLDQFLSSKRVQDQTDDDTTLVLATRFLGPSSVLL